MKKAFSMIELIFVIVLVGILGTAMVMSMPDERLRNDLDFITQKIKAKQMQALSYDNFDYQTKQFKDDTTCIFINKNSLNGNEQKSALSNPYRISAQTTLTPDDLNVCFDNIGRPYKLNHFENLPIMFNIVYKDQTKSVHIMPYSGSVAIKK